MDDKETELWRQLAQYHDRGSWREEAEGLVRLGARYQEERRWDEAEAVCRQIFERCDRQGDALGKSQALAWIAKMKEIVGDYEAAASIGRQSNSIFEAMPLEVWVAAYHNGHPFLTLDAHERRLGPEAAFTYRAQTSRSWVSGLRLRRRASGVFAASALLNPTERLVARPIWPQILAAVPLYAGIAGTGYGGHYVFLAIGIGLVTAALSFSIVKRICATVIAPGRPLVALRDSDETHVRVKRLTGYVHVAMLAIAWLGIVQVLQREGVLR